MIAHPSYTFTEFELEWIMSAEFSHLPYDQFRRYGDVNVSSFAEVCAQTITDNFEVSDYVDDPEQPNWKGDLSAYIENVVRQSERGIAVAVAALTLIERYQDELVELGDSSVYEVEGVCRLFLTAFMAAAKYFCDENPSMSFWTRVAGGGYSSTELAVMEREFLFMIDWRVWIDPDHYENVFVSTIQNYDAVETAKNYPQGLEPFMLTEWGMVEKVPSLDPEDEELFVRALKEVPQPPLLGESFSFSGLFFGRASRSSIHS